MGARVLRVNVKTEINQEMTAQSLGHGLFTPSKPEISNAGKQ